ncbi:MAG: Xaa-Pro peptidase family protein [Gemmatimonadota bacterium]|nr:aminopeptidase P family protein [Gemmatimonadota bacterium]
MSLPARSASVLAVPWVLLAAVVPLHGSAQTPEQPYFAWTAMDEPASELQARRDRTREALTALGGAGAPVLLVPGAEGLSDGETFRQDDDFWWLTGLEVPRSLVAIDAEGATLFVPERDFRFENPSRRNDFPGRALASDPELARRTGIARVLPADSLDGWLERVATAGRAVYVHAPPEPPAPALFGPPPTPAQRLVAWLAAHHPDVERRDATPVFQRVRAVKTEAEMTRVRRVAQLTSSAIAEAAALVRPGVTERDLEASFEAACKRGGAQRIPFHPIIKSGPNSLWPWRILAAHYDRRNRALQAGDLVIFDVGCELDHYVSDVGRTFPVSGRFSAEQREVLTMEVGVSDRILAAIRPGVTFADLRRVADEAIPDHEKPYMQVGLFFGHAIGLSTGDPFDETEPLRPGTVFTVEPWYYNHERGISVFTEDVVVVTEDGVEVLTAGLPREPAALEALVGAVVP